MTENDRGDEGYSAVLVGHWIDKASNIGLLIKSTEDKAKVKSKKAKPKSAGSRRLEAKRR